MSKKQKNKRILKVYYKYIPTSFRDKKVSEIRLSGDWLKDAGFVDGHEIEVEIEQGIMLITLKNESA